MGYFNIFYKITRIIDMLTRKRNRRAIMVILIIIAVIFILHNKGYCAQSDSDYTTDTSYFMIEEYNNILDEIRIQFDRFYGNTPTLKTRFDDIFTKVLNGQYLYITYDTSTYLYKIYTYEETYNKTLVDTSLVYNDYTRVPSTAYNITIPSGSRVYKFRTFDNWVGYDDLTSDANIAVPLILYHKLPTQFYDMMTRAGFTYQNNQDIVDIKALLQAQNQKLDTINDSLTNTTYDEDVVDFDTSSVDNVSDTEIQGLFTGVIGSFQNALASYGGTITKIIPLPHGGQLEIPSNIVSSHLGNLSALVEAFWYFVFGIYLFRFVSNLIHKIKSGDILNGYTNDNEIITSSML